ncbi:MAG: DNA repair protein RadA [Cryomorphaceae bacterium]|nr:MAG: DNA repair protein RadA [Cryomorphaceae bacterium]
MAKVKTAFFCSSCGYESPKWLGKCPGCGSWNTMVEELLQPKSAPLAGIAKAARKPVQLGRDTVQDVPRIQLPGVELNRVLGGGLMPGAVTLIGGEPGIGKSTLMLQVALDSQRKVLYVSGEESEMQIQQRAKRIGIQNEQCYILAETLTQNILEVIEEMQPEVVIIDSVQTLHSRLIESSAGSVSQIRQCTAELIAIAKELDLPLFLVGHITKDGNIAGPKVLEHMVDTVLQFEGDRHFVYRMLRSVKNRFGSTHELGIFEMTPGGLREVHNPSEILIGQHDDGLSGTTVAATVEGARPLLIEVQALVSTAAFGTPQRSATGFDTRRLNMLLAVLEKRCGFKLAMKDVFVNIAGGLRVEDPALDLAIVAAVLSSNSNIEVPRKICLAAEVGLTGEVRTVSRLDQRIAEAGKLGFEQIIVSRHHKATLAKTDIQVVEVGRVDEVFRLLFG